MKTRIQFDIFFILLLLPVVSFSRPDTRAKISSSQIAFTENKGQVRDQDAKSRHDVLFGGIAGGLVFHLRNNGISYQLSRVDSWKVENEIYLKNERKIIDQSTTYRVDIDWLNCDKDAHIKKKNPRSSFDNYYMEGYPNGIHGVKTYGEIIYEQIYSGIDLKWYDKNGILKYDYVVSAGANYKNIQLEIKGASEISLTDKCELLIKTPLGNILEQAPLVIQNGKKLKAKWKINKTIISFEIENVDPLHSFVIDPAVRIWGTYYGGISDESAYSCKTDFNRNVYMCGMTMTSGGTLIATAGSHQSTFGGNTYDAFLVKLDSNGVRQWGTYYGGAANDYAYSCTTDNSGNVYVAGTSGSSISIATAGCHQSTYAGGNDAFLVVFNSNGVRQWGTYYGGTSSDGANGCALDSNGDIFICGYTLSNNPGAISSAGSHQVSPVGSFESFLVKFNSAGVRQWGTYYGGVASDIGHMCSTDASNNIYMSGYAASSTGTIIATIGSHQPLYGGGPYDGYLVKFNSSGLRLWGTYYGGAGDEAVYSCATSPAGDVYITGQTSSSTGTAMASLGTHQQAYGGGTFDAFLAQFNSSGIRQWATYYGGPGIDNAYATGVDSQGNAIIVGRTSCTASAVITTPGSHQTGYGGSSFDAFLASFNSAGTRQIGTYYSGLNDDVGYACCADPSGNYYIAGTALTPSGSAISTPGCHQYTLTGYTDAFIAKLFNCSYPASPINITPPINQSVCVNTGSTVLMVNGPGIINWYTTPTATFALGSGTNLITPVLPTGTYTFYTEAVTCLPSLTRTPITFTIFPNPTVTVNSGSICSGNSFTFNPSGALSYTVQGGSTIVSPTITSSYTVIGSNNGGCLSSNVPTANVIVSNLPLPTITVNSGSICSGSSFTISPIGANTYTFSGGSPIVSPLTNTSYSITGTSTAGCVSGSAAISNVTVVSSPTVSVNSGSICSGNSFTIIPTGANSYTIEGGIAIVSPTASTSYTVVGSDLVGCVSVIPAAANVTVNALPFISVNSGSICTGQSFTVSPSGADTYTFSGGSPIVSPTITTSYSVSGTSSVGCVSNSFAITNITVFALPGITVNSGSICSGNNFTIIPNGANSYTISGGLAIVSPTSSTSYSVMGTSVNGCLSSGPSISNVTVYTFPLPTVNVNSGTICAGQVFTIFPTGAANYSISGGSNVVAPLVNTSYSVIGTSTNGCLGQSVAVCGITVYPLPALTISATPQNTICVGETATLSVISGVNNYTWNTGAMTQSIVISPSLTSNYWVTVSDANGCYNTDAINIAVCTGLFFNNNTENVIRIFPNPTDDHLNIDFAGNIYAKKIKLYNSIGQLLYELDNLQDSYIKLSLDKYAIGIYFLQVEITNQVFFTKVIKQ